MSDLRRQLEIMERVWQRAHHDKRYDRLLPLLTGTNRYYMNVTYGIGYEPRED